MLAVCLHSIQPLYLKQIYTGTASGTMANISSKSVCSGTLQPSTLLIATSHTNSVTTRYYPGTSRGVCNTVTTPNVTMSTMTSLDAATCSSTMIPPISAPHLGTIIPPTSPCTLRPAASRPISRKRLPFRPGITWMVGSKVEAKDFMQKWYV